MKKSAILAVLSAAVALFALAGGCSRQNSAMNEAEPAVHANWLTDAAAAFAQSKAEGKFLVMDFTGSDWCPPCLALEREVFTRPAFKEYADANLVLLKLDFPNRKQLPEAEQLQNFRLQDQYKVEGYPTIIVLAPSGEELGRLSYLRGGAPVWLEALRQITKT